MGDYGRAWNHAAGAAPCRTADEGMIASACAHLAAPETVAERAAEPVVLQVAWSSFPLFPLAQIPLLSLAELHRTAKELDKLTAGLAGSQDPGDAALLGYIRKEYSVISKHMNLREAETRVSQMLVPGSVPPVEKLNYEFASTPTNALPLQALTTGQAPALQEARASPARAQDTPPRQQAEPTAAAASAATPTHPERATANDETRATEERPEEATEQAKATPDEDERALAYEKAQKAIKDGGQRVQRVADVTWGKKFVVFADSSKRKRRLQQEREREKMLANRRARSLRKKKAEKKEALEAKRQARERLRAREEARERWERERRERIARAQALAKSLKEGRASVSRQESKRSGSAGSPGGPEDDEEEDEEQIRLEEALEEELAANEDDEDRKRSSSLCRETGPGDDAADAAAQLSDMEQVTTSCGDTNDQEGATQAGDEAEQAFSEGAKVAVGDTASRADEGATAENASTNGGERTDEADGNEADMSNDENSPVGDDEDSAGPNNKGNDGDDGDDGGDGGGDDDDDDAGSSHFGSLELGLPEAVPEGLGNDERKGGDKPGDALGAPSPGTKLGSQAPRNMPSSPDDLCRSEQAFSQDEASPLEGVRLLEKSSPVEGASPLEHMAHGPSWGEDAKVETKTGNEKQASLLAQLRADIDGIKKDIGSGLSEFQEDVASVERELAADTDASCATPESEAAVEEQGTQVQHDKAGEQEKGRRRKDTIPQLDAPDAGCNRSRSRNTSRRSRTSSSTSNSYTSSTSSSGDEAEALENKLETEQHDVNAPGASAALFKRLGDFVVDYSDLYASFGDIFTLWQTIGTRKHNRAKLLEEAIESCLRTFANGNREVAVYLAASQPAEEASSALVSWRNQAHGRFFRVLSRARNEVSNIVKEACRELDTLGLNESLVAKLTKKGGKGGNGDAAAAKSPMAPLPGDSGPVWNLLWTWSKPKVNRESLLMWQRVNHFHQARALTRKDLLKRELHRYRSMSKFFAQEFELLPDTFILPKEYIQFVDAFTRYGESHPDANYWIMKPVGLSRGRGISLVGDINDVCYGQSTIIQRYVHNPLLLDGYKFDLRIYVLVTSFKPLEVFMYEEGFVRVCTHKYSAESIDLHNLFIHLTNSSIQKLGPNGSGTKATAESISRHSAEIDEAGGTKLSLTYLWRRLRAQGFDVDAIKRSIQLLVLKSLVCCDDTMTHQPNSFELFGYDVLLDETLRPWLIEVNSSPSMAQENQLDTKVKRELVADTLRLVNPVAFDRAVLLEVLQRRAAELERNRLRPFQQQDTESERDRLNRDLTAILHGARPRKFAELPACMGKYRRLCPNEDVHEELKRILRQERSHSRCAGAGAGGQRAAVKIPVVSGKAGLEHLAAGCNVKL